MKIAFDVDVLAKQMSINDYVHKVADWGYKYIEQSPHPRINPIVRQMIWSVLRISPDKPEFHPLRFRE
jgi:myo-inositol catabolism protein IolH